MPLAETFDFALLIWTRIDIIGCNYFKSFFRALLTVLLGICDTTGMSQSNSIFMNSIEEIGSNIEFMRHSFARGFGERDNFALSDCGTRRNLDRKERRQARKIGRDITASSIKFLQILSDQW